MSLLPLIMGMCKRYYSGHQLRHRGCPSLNKCAGADVNMMCKGGWMTLENAMNWLIPNCANILIDAGADVSITDLCTS